VDRVFESFAHYLSYGATDQQTARRLSGSYTGLLVPGTVAAFQRAGTGGFVLTLSATSASPEYVIDSRFPLFQQRLRSPKRSHEALADLLGAPELVQSNRDPEPDDFTQDLIGRVARGWYDFNTGYMQIAQKSFDKYAKRLGEEIQPTNTKAPRYILPPYLIATKDEPRWWDVSSDLYTATRALGDESRFVRVVATDRAALLESELPRVDDERVAVWVSDLNELTTSAADLARYGRAIRDASGRGIQVFALYGGFYSVLLRRAGLRGSSHGIGYGESRAWVELPQSGPPPARYYMPMLHRYVSQDLAYQLWARNPALAECPCRACDGEAPISLDYQQLMEHSVLCRAGEIVEWSELSYRSMRRRLRADYNTFAEEVGNMALPPGIASQARKSYEHLPTWMGALRILRDEEDVLNQEEDE
jgi:hypothetical protein